MVRFVDQQFIFDNNNPVVLVVDADLQGGWESRGGYLEDLQWAYPRVYNIYKTMCRTAWRSAPGTSVLIEEGGYKIGILFTKRHRKEKPEIVQENFEKALKNLLDKIPSNEWIYSPIMGRKDGTFPGFLVTINKLIKDLNYNWYVYKK